MTTLIRPTLHRNATFTGVTNPNIILSTEEGMALIEALTEVPGAEAEVKEVFDRMVPNFKERGVSVEDWKYPHFLRMLSGEITTVEYDAIRARIDVEFQAA